MIVLDYQDRRPIYEQIVERFQLLIIQGVMEADSQVPSVRKLAMELSINPNTIQRAYTELERQGFLYSVRGRGNYVSPNPDIVEKKREIYFEGLRKLIAQGRNLGIPKALLLEQAEKFYEEGQYDTNK